MIRRSLLSLAGAGLACAMALAPATFAAAQDYPPMPTVGAPKPFVLPATETYALPNGIEVTLIPYGLTPKTVVSIRVPTGNIDDGADTWLSDMTVDMMREGAGGRDAGALAQAAAGMGGGLQTGVGMYETSLSLNVLSEHGPAAVGLLADVARRPMFPEASLERVRQNRLRNLAVARSGSAGQAEAALAAALYGADHPYGQFFPTTEQLSSYTLEQLRAFHAAHFGARGTRIYVAGQFDPAAMKAAIAAAFGDWAAGPAPTSPPATADRGLQVILVDRPGAAQSTLRLAFPAPSIGGAEDARMRVMNTLLGGAFNSRITRNIREAKGYTYSPGSGLTFRDRNETTWVFNADVTTAVTGASLTEVFSEIRRMQTEAPTAAENQGARNYMAGIFVLQNATAAGVLASVANRDLFDLPDEWLNGYVPSVLAVTPEQMQAAAGNLALDRMTLVVVGDMATVRPQIEALPELQGATFQVVTP